MEKQDQLTFEQKTAIFAFEAGLNPEYLDVKNIKEITQNPFTGEYIVSFNGSNHQIHCSRSLEMEGHIVLLDEQNGKMYTDTDCISELEKLYAAQVQKIIIETFYGKKDLIYNGGLQNLNQTIDETKEMLVDKLRDGSPYITDLIYGQQIDAIDSIMMLHFHGTQSTIIETPTQTVVSSYLPFQYKYNEIMFASDASLTKETAMDRLLESVKKELGPNASKYQIDTAFEAKLTEMLKEDPKAVKEMLAEMCYQKGLSPILITGFDTRRSYYEVDLPEANMSIVSKSKHSMTTGQEITRYDGSNEHKFDHSMMVVNNDTTLICAIGFNNHPFGEIQRPKILSSIDFSQELHEIRMSHLPELMQKWQQEIPDWAQQSVASGRFEHRIKVDVDRDSLALESQNVEREQ